MFLFGRLSSYFEDVSFLSDIVVGVAMLDMMKWIFAFFLNELCEVFASFLEVAFEAFVEFIVA